MEIIFIALGGALGALARFFTVKFSAVLFGVDFPYGTLMVNTIGSFLLVFFMILSIEKLSIDPSFRLFFGVGFLGAFTTFSSFSYETISLFSEGEIFKGLLNIFLNNLFSIGSGILGFFLAKHLS